MRTWNISVQYYTYPSYRTSTIWCLYNLDTVTCPHGHMFIFDSKTDDPLNGNMFILNSKTHYVTLSSSVDTEDTQYIPSPIHTHDT